MFSYYSVYVVVCLVLLCICESQKRLVCPQGLLPCTCEVVGSGSKKALDINCQGKGFHSIPDLRVLRHHPITRLDMSHNNIDTIPDDVLIGLHFVPLYLTDKATINFDHNPLSKVSPDSFQSMKAYHTAVYLQHCHLDHIPTDALLPLDNLVALYVSHNHITHIPDDTFLGFNKLEILDISGNQIRQVNRNSLKGLERSLETLILKDIGLIEFPHPAVKRLRKLNSLTLDGNSITQLPDNVFNGFRSDNQGFILSLKNNQLGDIPNNTFSANNVKLRLYHLLLDGNRLTNVHFLHYPCTTVFYPRNSFVFLDKNPLDCDCDFYSVCMTAFYHLKGECQAPASYHGLIFYVSPGSQKALQFVGQVENFESDCEDVARPEWDLSCTIATRGSVSSRATTIITHSNVILTITFFIIKHLLDLHTTPFVLFCCWSGW